MSATVTNTRATRAASAVVRAALSVRPMGGRVVVGVRPATDGASATRQAKTALFAGKPQPGTLILDTACAYGRNPAYEAHPGGEVGRGASPA